MAVISVLVEPARHSLLPGVEASTPVAASAAAAVAVAELPSLAVLGELTGSAGGALESRNGANAPADNPEDADTLPARGLRPDLSRRGGEAPVGEAAVCEVAAGASEPGAGSRGTPGMSQPGSDIARLPPPGQLANLNRSHVRLYRHSLTFLEPLFASPRALTSTDGSP
jgi:hypothetical protein